MFTPSLVYSSSLKPRLDAGVLLDPHLVATLDQVAGGGRNERDAAFEGLGFLGNTDTHRIMPPLAAMKNAAIAAHAGGFVIVRRDTRALFCRGARRQAMRPAICSDLARPVGVSHEPVRRYP